MRTLKDLLPKKQAALLGGKNTLVDEQTVFYIAKKVLVEEYGLRGGENIIPVLFKEATLHLSARSSLWGNEIWLEKERLQKKMNTLMGGSVIRTIKVDRG